MIQSRIEDPLAEEILSGRIQKGQTVEVVLNKKKEIEFQVVQKTARRKKDGDNQ